MSLRLTPFAGGEWIATWTLFYWAWWIAWAPFVGTFIARVSRGRTIREFVLGVLVAPTCSASSGLRCSVARPSSSNSFRARDWPRRPGSDISTALFLTLEQLPFGMILSVSRHC